MLPKSMNEKLIKKDEENFLKKMCLGKLMTNLPFRQRGSSPYIFDEVAFLLHITNQSRLIN